jgi:hypothetical protein
VGGSRNDRRCDRDGEAAERAVASPSARETETGRSMGPVPRRLLKHTFSLQRGRSVPARCRAGPSTATVKCECLALLSCCAPSAKSLNHRHRTSPGWLGDSLANQRLTGCFLALAGSLEPLCRNTAFAPAPPVSIGAVVAAAPTAAPILRRSRRHTRSVSLRSAPPVGSPRSAHPADVVARASTPPAAVACATPRPCGVDQLCRKPSWSASSTTQVRAPPITAPVSTAMRFGSTVGCRFGVCPCTTTAP